MRIEGETEVLGGNLSQCYFIHHKFHMTWLGSNSGRRGGKWANNRLSEWVTLRLEVYSQPVVLAPSLLRIMSRVSFFLQQNPYGHSPCVTSSLTRGWLCLLWTVKVKVKVTLRPTVSQPVFQSVSMSSPIWNRRPDLLTVSQLSFCRCGASSLKRGRVCHLSRPYYFERPTNYSSHFASRVLIQFLWFPKFCLLLTLPHWALSWSAEIPLRLLRKFRSETSVCIRSLNWLGVCRLRLKGGGAGICLAFSNLNA
jgi:hypothetical protein